MICDICAEEEALFMVGNMQTGDQVAFGPACFARQGLEAAKALLPAEEIAAQLGPMFVQMPGDDAEAPAEGRKGKRRPPAQAEPAEPSQPAPGAAEIPPTAKDG